MSLTRRLRLDEVVASLPELGPTVPDGGYSWIVLFGVFLIQMTVPTVLSIYGIVLGYIARNAGDDFDLWSEKIVLTPILFVSFWSLADPWSKAIVRMASIPTLVALIGVVLLSTGIVASGYLATGGVGAYLASSSAGAVMGIGASFLTLQADHVLRRYFRKKLLTALTVKNLGASVGSVLVPGLVYLLLVRTDLKNGLLLLTLLFVPTTLGALTLRPPAARGATPYRPLLSEEDRELPITLSPEAEEEEEEEEAVERGDKYESDNSGYREEGLLGEGNDVYAYREPNEEDSVELFVDRSIPPSADKWKHRLSVLRSFRFWLAALALAGTKACALLLWILPPALYSLRATSIYAADWATLSTLVGAGTLMPGIVGYKILGAKTLCRRTCFGGASCLCGLALLGFACSESYASMASCAFFGGLGIGYATSSQELAACDILGIEAAHRAEKGLSTVVGTSLLLLCFANDATLSLVIVGLFQLIGGIYWISVPLWRFLERRRNRSSRSGGDRT
ncbi:hypothetical protein KM043_006176 [Ampulex compressa]|nr:hypothetical protein KM043_006176 [Ampulex compressa]